MSIAMERNNSGGDPRAEGSGFIFSIYDDDRRSDEDYRSSSSSTSSIGKNSDECDSDGGKNDCEEEVESEYKGGGPLDSLEDLEEVLPVKKSISKFYNGKSKSFTSLSDAVSCSSITEITKPEDPYSKKRKNLLAFNYLWDKSHNNFSRAPNGGLSKRPSSSRSMVSLAASVNSSESNSGKTSNLNRSPPDSCLPPLPPHARRGMHSGLPSIPPPDKFSSLRSFSLSDLQGAAGAEAAIPSNNGIINSDNVSRTAVLDLKSSELGVMKKLRTMSIFMLGEDIASTIETFYSLYSGVHFASDFARVLKFLKGLWKK